MNEIKEYLNNVFMISVRTRSFDWRLPHQTQVKKNEKRGAAFALRYKGKVVLATCFHVLRDGFYISLSSPVLGALQYPCRVVWICPVLDLAILEVEDEDIKKKLYAHKGLIPCVFQDFKKKTIPGPMIGDTVQTVGFPLGQTNLKITKGIISGQQAGLFQTDAPINGGNSGGPLIWKKKVVGINVSGYIFAQNVAYAIPISRLLHLIDYHQTSPKQFIIRFPRIIGFMAHPPISKLVASTSKKPIDKWCGVEVSAVFPHQMFSATSLKKGDILLKLNDIKISRLGELDLTWMNQNMTIFNYFHHIYMGQKLKIEYKRKGSNKHIREHVRIEPESQKICYRQWYTEYEEIPYLYFCGIVMIPFNETVMKQHRFDILKLPQEDLPIENKILLETKSADDYELLRYMDPECWCEGRVMVSNILKGGTMETLHILTIGDILTSVNKHPISSIRQVSHLIRKSFKNKTPVSLGFHKKQSITIPIDFFRQEEKTLSRLYKYDNPLYYDVFKEKIKNDETTTDNTTIIGKE